jgi:dethiobiotin synthetase/adenosylmethionine--8-amino-7-oxononanoate aminotransferase
LNIPAQLQPIMRRTGAGLWRSLVAFQVYGANTNVGKTVASTILCKVLGDAPKLRARPGGESESKSRVHYLKPVSTGPVEHVDSR